LGTDQEQELMTKPFHAMTTEQVFKEFGARKEGLSVNEIQKQRGIWGLNKLEEKAKETALEIMIKQFKDFFIYLLIFAAAASFIIAEYVNSEVISAIVLLCVVVAFFQEYRASKALDALKELAAPTARVIRDGKEITIPSEELVPGDILSIQEGDKIPADALLFKVVAVKINEMILTGESKPVRKELKIVDPKAIIGDRKNMVFSTTDVVSGRGEAVVVKTGKYTEYGQIAEAVLGKKEEEPPFLDEARSPSAKAQKQEGDRENELA